MQNSKRKGSFNPKTPVRTLIIGLLTALSAAVSWASASPDTLAINTLIDGLHRDAHSGQFDAYFDRYTPAAVFMGTDKTERWTIDEFKRYAAPAFADGHAWSYTVIERNVEGDGDTRWFDEILLNEKLGHCRGTGVVQRINGEWKLAHYSLTLLIPNNIAADVGVSTQKADGLIDLQKKAPL